MRRKILTLCAVLTLFAGCGGAGSREFDNGGPIRSESVNSSVESKVSIVNPAGEDLESRIMAPEGYIRTAEEKGSLGDFLRNYKMLPDGSPVMLYNGKPRTYDASVCVFDMYLGNKDLQQCADSIMRIYAEYLKTSGREGNIAFHLADGSLCDWNTYKNAGSSFESYLEKVYTYAGTFTMQDECVKTSIEKLQIGDVFIKGGSPGHVVMVADMCEKGGKKAFLLAQGYMPAQQFHILKNPLHDNDPWYYEDEVLYPFTTPEFTFPEGSLMHPTYLD